MYTSANSQICLNRRKIKAAKSLTFNLQNVQERNFSTKFYLQFLKKEKKGGEEGERKKRKRKK